jgi:myo-inositol-1-phosphate synthase
MQKIRIALVGVGNCASALIQGTRYYEEKSEPDSVGLMHWDIGGYKPWDMEVVLAVDVDRRKVGRDLSDALFARPNCTKRFCEQMPQTGLIVRMGCILDGVPPHMLDYPDEYTFAPAQEPEPDKDTVVKWLRESKAEILVNYLPVGSENAVRFYVECALAADVALVNCMPVFIASDPVWSARFEARRLPLIGDDVKSQLGATIVHRALTDLFRKRGVKLERTYQLNTGGNTDFLNMLNRERLASKKISKTEAVQSVAADRLADRNIHVGPSDYVPWQDDNKICFIRMEGSIFGNVPMNLELRMSVEDSPNSAGVVIDAIRCCKMALQRGIGGVLEGPSAFLMKHPPLQFPDDQAHALMETFIQGIG